MAVEADYVYSKGTNEKDVVDNINLSFDPATGLNYPFSDRSRRPFPDWGVVSMNAHLGRSVYHTALNVISSQSLKACAAAGL